MEYTIRHAGFSDSQAIFSLIREYPDELLARPISEILQNIDRCLVAERHGKVIGTVSWAILPELGLATDPTVEIKSLAVSAEYKGQGIGMALIQKAIEYVMELKPSRIIALTFTPEFFARAGFREVAKEDLMHKLYMGCVNCSKYDSPFTCPEVAMCLPCS